jgi:ketosteroid isomerase-like protein
MTDPTFEDWLAIVGGLNRMAALMDAREWDRIGEVVLPDARCYGQLGHEAIAANVLRRALGGCGPTQHLLGNYDIHVDGDVAKSRSLIRAYHLEAGGEALEEPRTYVWMGVYLDRWRRTGDGWRMSERKTETNVSVGDASVLQPG